jgi:hypothetical protein
LGDHEGHWGADFEEFGEVQVLRVVPLLSFLPLVCCGARRGEGRVCRREGGGRQLI